MSFFYLDDFEDVRADVLEFGFDLSLVRLDESKLLGLSLIGTSSEHR